MNVAAIVDDTVDVRRMVRVLLERAGATIGLEASTIDEAVGRLDPGATGVVILDHHLEGDVSGYDGSALIRAHAPGVKIVLFTSMDMADEAAANPDVAAFLRKDRVLELPRIVQRLIDEIELHESAPKHDSIAAMKPTSVEDLVLAEWLMTPSVLFGELPPPLDAADTVHQLLVPDADRSDTLLRFVAAAGDVDRAIAHLLALRHVIERDSVATSLINRSVLDVLIVEVTSNVIVAARRAAMVDPLTGAANRRALEGDLASALARCERMKQVLTVVYFDLVGLKLINDREGHHEGDRALKSFADALDISKRTGDGCYRVCGDEFLAVLPDATTDDAAAFVDRVAAAEPPKFSYGAADTLDAGYDGSRLVRLADIRLLSERYGHRPTP